MSKSTNDPSVADGVAARLLARRDRQAQTRTEGDEGQGSLGDQIAREPLFVGLGLRGRHHAGKKDSDAPPVKRKEDGSYEDLGAPDEAPARPRRHRM